MRPHIQGFLSSTALAAVAGATLLLPLMLIPGYFSHDEFQWAAMARPLVGEPARVAWTDVGAFQYRPLTFQVWLWLSKHLFDSPRLFHTAIALIGLGNALLLRQVLVRLGLAPAYALAGLLLFLVHPYSVYVNGWVATLADQLWVGAGLSIAHLIATDPGRDQVSPWRLLAALLLTACALLAKEAAVVLPCLVGLAWVFARRPALLRMTVATAAPVVLYLLLRADVILSRPGDGTYGWSALMLPPRLLQYFAFPMAVRLPEIGILAGKPGWAAFGLLAAGAQFWAVWRTSPRLGLWCLLAGTAALGPVLILTSASNQYGYAFAAVSAGVWAAALGRASGPRRIVLMATLALVALHGAVVGLHMVESGRRAAVFSPAVAELLRQSPPLPLRLRPAKGVDPWLYTRLLHAIPHYRGAVFADRVRLVAADEAADYEILGDGSLRALSTGNAAQ